ncbi:DUF7410 domain-containing protein [Halobellus limi]|uniref:C2H2-type domain-containing protein n=1 Tax=Halobellus limi TaxID=699433 RepID=A0A1H5YXH5_9EURY|nr:hypothetical protein [Halobellus limi]QCC48318.1 hypothetical protein DV707_11960 [Halobellus limi]SEG28135.1 hypothetical protein SAMN04488133_1742 [Halobellus limi]
MSDVPSAPETAVPDGEREAAVCPHCGRPFVTERQRALHVGERHDATPAERRAYEDAREDESDELFRLHLKVVFAVGLLYAASVVAGVVAFSLPG